MLLNLDGLIPAVILLILHFTVGVPLWIAIVAAILWLSVIIINMLVFGWFYSQKSDLPEKSQQINNPYAKKGVIIKGNITKTGEMNEKKR